MFSCIKCFEKGSSLKKALIKINRSVLGLFSKANKSPFLLTIPPVNVYIDILCDVCKYLHSKALKI